MKTSKEVDEYIDRSQAFAKPILQHLRTWVHTACPTVEETIKWGFPHFIYKGILCSMAAFKQHCAFTFWKGAVMKDPDDILTLENKTSMGSLGRLASVADLPDEKILLKYIHEAVALNDQEIKRMPSAKAGKSKAVDLPEDFANALSKNSEAAKIFSAFSYSSQKDYVEWIEQAKTQATRAKRLQTAVEWISEGKRHNWRYIKIKS